MPEGYLIRLDYGGGRSAWVHNDNNCTGGLTNGRFTSQVSVLELARRAFSSGTWPALPAAAACSDRTQAGRAGQERELVPAGWRRLLLCADGSGPDRQRRELVGAEARALVDALNALPVGPFKNSGSCGGPDAVPVRSSERVGTLLVDYGAQRTVEVYLSPGCTPFATNYSVQAAADSSQQDAILDVLRD